MGQDVRGRYTPFLTGTGWEGRTGWTRASEVRIDSDRLLPF